MAGGVHGVIDRGSGGIDTHHLGRRWSRALMAMPNPNSKRAVPMIGAAYDAGVHYSSHALELADEADRS